MKIFFDTEFIEDGKTIDLISIGLVREDGAELYRECKECDLSKASPWVRENVLPHLSGKKTSRFDIQRDIVAFVGSNPEFYAYYASYDWICLCQLFGTMMDLPKDFPMFPIDLKQYLWMIGNPPLPKQMSTEHNALADAYWNMEVYAKVILEDFKGYGFRV